MDWLEKLKQAREERDEEEAARIHAQLPKLPTPKGERRVGILIPKRDREK